MIIPYKGNQPFLYSEWCTPDNTNGDDFTGNGYGSMSEGVSCFVTEEINTSYELVMKYPVSGALFNDIAIGAYIKARSNPYGEKQIFRIYRITKPINGIITIYAEHISYLLSGYPAMPNDDYEETKGEISTLINYLNDQISAIDGLVFPFEFSYSGSFPLALWSVKSPTNIRAIIKNAVSWFGGEWEFNGYNCILRERRGEDRNTKLIYSQNILNLTQDIDSSNTHTHIMPYYSKDSTFVGNVNNIIAIPTVPLKWGQKSILPVDFTSEFETTPTLTQLNEKATEYVTENTISKITISHTSKFLIREQTAEYKDLGDFDHVELGDTLHISVPHLGISSEAICRKTVYNVYAGKYEDIQIGDKKENIVDTLSKIGSSGNTGRYPMIFSSMTSPSEDETNDVKKNDIWLRTNNNYSKWVQAIGRYDGSSWDTLGYFSTLRSGVYTWTGNGENQRNYNITPVIQNVSFVIILYAGSYGRTTGAYMVYGQWLPCTIYEQDPANFANPIYYVGADPHEGTGVITKAVNKVWLGGSALNFYIGVSSDEPACILNEEGQNYRMIYLYG